MENDKDQNLSSGEVEGESLRASEGIPTGIRSIRDLVDLVTGRNLEDTGDGDAGLAELWPFPFLAIVGQKEMKLGLILALINPHIGGALLVGPRGTGKTTAVRSLIDLMPNVTVSNCYYGCLEEDVEVGGKDSLCPNCVEKFTQGEMLSSVKPVRLVELPLNAQLEDILGSVDERAAIHSRIRVKRGILSVADKNLLYIDEVNLLRDEVVDAILDAAAQGSFTIRRGQFSAMYRSRFTLIGTMNPEEGTLRPQIMDRFGLRLLVKGLEDIEERKIAYERAKVYLNNPRRLADQFADATLAARDEILAVRKTLPNVGLPEDVIRSGLELIKKFNIASIRAEITLFEAARALAAADNRLEVSFDDLKQVAPMALRLRRSQFISNYFEIQSEEEEELFGAINNLGKENGK